MSTTPSNSWTLGHLRPWSFSFAASCLDVFVLIAFMCAYIFGCCINLDGVIFGMCMYPSFLTVSLPMIRYPLASMTRNAASLGAWHPMRSTALHDPVVATGESPYPVIITICSSRQWCPNIDLHMYQGMMLHPDPLSTSQSNLWTCALGCVANHSGLMCLLSSCLLRLFTCIVFMWWNVTPCNPLFEDGLCCVVYGCCSHVPAVACALSSWTFDGCLLFTSFVLPTSFFNVQLPLECPFFPQLYHSVSLAGYSSFGWKCCFTAVAGLVHTLTSVFCRWSFPLVFCLHHV